MKTWIKYLIIIVAVIIILFGGGFLTAYLTRKPCPTNSDINLELLRIKDSLKTELILNTISKEYYIKKIDSLQRVNYINYKIYKDEIKNLANINTISDDSVTRYISNYLHNKR